MKFCKTYQNQLKEPVTELPVIGFKRLKKTLRKCKTRTLLQNDDITSSSIHHHSDCTVCDGTFFPSLLDEMSAVVNSFNRSVQKLLDPPSPNNMGIWRYLTAFKGKGLHKYRAAEVKEAHYLLIYAMVNAIAFRKILKKYDKIHKCEKGSRFKSGVQVQHIDIIQSPWLYELIAFHINLRDAELMDVETETMYAALALKFDDSKPSMTCELFGSFKIDIDLVCPICLDIIFDAMALTCGHILCYMCACSAASVTIVDGLKTATAIEKCPLCREARVYGDAIRLEQLNILLSKRCPEYWVTRLESERTERVRLVKEHWDTQCRAFMGM